MTTSDQPILTLPVLPASRFVVSHGVNEGDPLTPADEMVLEDVYAVIGSAAREHLSLRAEGGGHVIAPGSEAGRAGDRVHLDVLASFMSPDGRLSEALVLVQTAPDSGLIRDIWLHPLGQMRPDTDYALVSLDRAAARDRLAQSALVSFARGTRITMADGRQVPVEELRPGARILTRDSGPQVLRWIGSQTLRASGAFAPIVIAPGALNNAGELTLSRNHRLFVYQRTDRIGAGAREVMVRAENLVNGTTVTVAEGGFIDYFQLLFDKHEIIYAEGIAAESLFMDAATGPAIPAAARRRLAGDARPARLARELGPADLRARDAVAVLKAASAS